MKFLKIIGIIVAALIIIMFGSLLVYRILHPQPHLTGYEINTIQAGNHILIASKGTEFKTSVLSNLIDRVKSDDVYIKVADLSVLNETDSSDWDAIIILVAYESAKLPDTVSKFINGCEEKDKLIVAATMGDPSKPVAGYGLDIISAASKMETVNELTINFAGRLSMILSKDKGL